ncbi:MAG TPA: ATP-binding cassette domain-containing protein [Methanosarcinales archaeon]|nr:ATP-binding cassette domain-containing protein [Methanosarcinales archaeon]
MIKHGNFLIHIEAHAPIKQFGKPTAVDNLDFRIAQGKFFSFFGHNGAGKTTTLQMLSCQVPPTTGTATTTVLGIDAAAVVVPVLVAQTLLSFYYQINDSIATLCIAGPGIILVAASKIIIGQLDTWWKSTMFRII